MSQIKRIFSGIQPSGRTHLGNYFGAIRQWVQLQARCGSVLYSIVDLHSLTTLQAPMLLKRNVRSMAVCLLACGVDPHKSIIFQQSQVPHHTSLAWLLACRTPTGWLARMTQWKAKGATDNRDLVGLGLFAYPVLQSADILLYKATHVPVGEDQLQHLELARDLARSFNTAYSPILPEPQPLIGEVRRVMSLRNPLQKMSKSDNQELSCINLSDSADEIRNKVMKAVTDHVGRVTYEPQERPGVANLVAIYAATADITHDDVCARFEGRQTVDLKLELADLLIDSLAPIREEMARLECDPEHVDAILKEGADKAREIAEENLNEVKRLVGIL